MRRMLHVPLAKLSLTPPLRQSMQAMKSVGFTPMALLFIPSVLEIILLRRGPKHPRRLVVSSAYMILTVGPLKAPGSLSARCLHHPAVHVLVNEDLNRPARAF
ncbi:hypothetical protein LX32DRAFT_32393 [Colletotrichum zoysiae]|uniref:Uncharacterized protein n=1 Tax=Colletotrichum zoysiae TaxID=1216348 RepID=A0AAD9HCI2_9PEZI|nr:hypothetical protein LX32DRAFT_32393 [Colletotrichum zoysiae]